MARAEGKAKSGLGCQEHNGKSQGAEGSPCRNHTSSTLPPVCLRDNIPYEAMGVLITTIIILLVRMIIIVLFIHPLPPRQPRLHFVLTSDCGQQEKAEGPRGQHLQDGQHRHRGYIHSCVLQQQDWGRVRGWESIQDKVGLKSGQHHPRTLNSASSQSHSIPSPNLHP